MIIETVTIRKGEYTYKIAKRDLDWWLKQGYHRVIASKNYWRRHDVSKTQRKISP